MTLPKHVQLINVPFGQRYINLPLISGDNNLLIDSGMSYSWEPHLLPGLVVANAPPERVDWLVNLHAHSDHIGGNALLFQASGGRTRIACHRDDAPFIREPIRVVRDLYHMPVDHPRFQSNVDDCGQPAPVHVELVDGVGFDLGQGVALRVVAAPGHTPGNIALWDEVSGTLFHGESIMGAPQQAPDGRMTAPYGADPLRYRQTLLALAALPIRTLIPSHEEPKSGEEAQALLHACLAGLDEYVAAVERAIKGGAADLDAVFGTVSKTYALRMPWQLKALYEQVRG